MHTTLLPPHEPFFCSMGHNAHTYAQPFHGPQCTHIRTTLAALTSPTHVPQCTRFYLLTGVFCGSEHKRNICFEEKKPQCVCKNSLERERRYTHTCQGNMVMAFFFFPFQSITIKIFPYSFFGGETYHFFLIPIKPTTSSNFFSFFYYIHVIFFTQK